MPLRIPSLILNLKHNALLLSAICAMALLGPGEAFAFQQDGVEVDFNEYSGEVKEASSNKSLVFATLTVEGTNISTITNTEGNFLLKVPKAYIDKNVVVSFLGYKTKRFPLPALSAKKTKYP